MASVNTPVRAPETASPRLKKKGQLELVMGRLVQSRMAMLGLAVVVILALVSIFAPLIAPYSPTTMDSTAIFATPSLKHLLGCDSLGRDQFSRLIYGGRYSLTLGFLAAALSALIGIILGTISGFLGGWVDNLVMRFLDVLQAIPGMLLSICISTVLGPGFFNTILALSVGGVAGITRILRACILSERRNEYLEAAASINCSTRRIMFKHLLPNTISPVIVNITMGIGATIMQAAALSYIGLGIQPPTPEWGAMLSAGRGYVESYPHLLIWPGVFIAVTVLAVNMLGDGLRDALDPKLKR